MLVLLNSDCSISAVMEGEKDIKNYYYDEKSMSLVEMPDFKGRCNVDDYLEYFVIEGKWVHISEIDIETLGKGIPPKLK